MNVKKLPVFRNLSDEELEKSLHCARSILVNFQKDEYIYRQEDEPKRLYFVLEGKVELGRAHRSGRLLRTEQVKEGDAFGAIEVFLGEQAHSCYAKAKTQVQVLAVDRYFFGGRCEKNCVHHAQVIKNMLQVFAERARENERQIELLTIGNLSQRVAAYLLEEAEDSSERTNNTGRNREKNGLGKPESGRIIRLRQNREELAAYLNTTRPSLSRILMQMQEEGLIAFPARNQIQIVDIEGLSELLGAPKSM